jgi:hypothetical protein
MAGKILQINFRIPARRIFHTVNHKARKGASHKHYKNNQHQYRYGQLAVPDRGMSKFGNEIHALGFLTWANSRPAIRSLERAIFLLTFAC